MDWCVQMKFAKRDAARDIVEKLGRVIQGLRDKGVGSELTSTETEFKEKVHFFICCLCCSVMPKLII
jgi:hypothetical protein